MDDPKQIAETVARLREEGTTLHGIAIDRGSVDASLSGLLADEAADLLQSLAAENAALKAEAEAATARLAEVEAERDLAQRHSAKELGWRVDMQARAEAAEAERDRLAAELAEARAAPKISCSLAFKKWTDNHPAKWNLGALWDAGEFVHFMDPDTDNAWMGFSAGWKAALTKGTPT